MNAEQLAREIANELFTNGIGDIADRLVCEVNGRDRGGWCRQAVERVIADRIKPLVETEEMVRYLRDAFVGCELHQHPGGTASFSVFFPKLQLDNCSALNELKILLYGREPEDEESEVNCD